MTSSSLSFSLVAGQKQQRLYGATQQQDNESNDENEKSPLLQTLYSANNTVASRSTCSTCIIEDGEGAVAQLDNTTTWPLLVKSNNDSSDNPERVSFQNDDECGPTHPQKLYSDADDADDDLVVRISLFHMHRYQMMHQHRMQLIFYMVLVLVYFGVTVTLLVANNFNQDFIEQSYYLTFHNLEFWGALVFSIAEALVFYTNSNNVNNNNTPLALALVSLNVVTSAAATFLFSLNPRVFEVPAHYIEYSTQITVTLLDYFFILQKPGHLQQQMQHGNPLAVAIKKNKDEFGVDVEEIDSQNINGELITPCSSNHNDANKNKNNRQILIQLVLATVLLFMSIIKFGLYVECLPNLGLGRERSSHYFEFVGEMMNSAWAFCFTWQQYQALEQELHYRNAWLNKQQHQAARRQQRIQQQRQQEQEQEQQQEHQLVFTQQDDCKAQMWLV